jgi:hypothetical protein
MAEDVYCGRVGHFNGSKKHLYLLGWYLSESFRLKVRPKSQGIRGVENGLRNIVFHVFFPEVLNSNSWYHIYQVRSNGKVPFNLIFSYELAQARSEEG